MSYVQEGDLEIIERDITSLEFSIHAYEIGLYPAAVLDAFTPLDVMKERLDEKKKRRGLLINRLNQNEGDE